jgi:hypothetical protein
MAQRHQGREGFELPRRLLITDDPPMAEQALE